METSQRGDRYRNCAVVATSPHYLEFPQISTPASVNLKRMETAEHRLRTVPEGSIHPIPLGMHSQTLQHERSMKHVTLPLYPARQLRRRSFNQYEEAYIFFKILFRLLARESSNSTPTSSSIGVAFASTSGACNPSELLWKAKQIVLECTRRNRDGQLDFQPLAQAVERHLRPAVGEYYWSLTYAYTRRFLQKFPLHRPTTQDNSFVPV
jgi:hypothetical protein